MTRSAGTSGLTRAGSPPRSAIASRMTARSTTAGHAGEVLEEDAGRHERDLGLGGDARPPRRQRLDVGRLDDPAAGVAEDVLEQDLERDRRPLEVDPVAERGQPTVVGQAGPEAGPGAERIGMGHASSVAVGRYTRSHGRVPRLRSGPAPRLGGPMKAWGGPPATSAGDARPRDETLRGDRGGGDRPRPGDARRPTSTATHGDARPRHDATPHHATPTSRARRASRRSSGSSGPGRSGRRSGSPSTGPAGRSTRSRAATPARRDRFREPRPGRPRVRRGRRRSSRRSS